MTTKKDPTYQIEGWDDHYENAVSRQIEQCTWCKVPNKQDGLQYRVMVNDPATAPFYGVFISLVLLCSKQVNRCGFLTHDGSSDGVPYTVPELSVKTGFPAKMVGEALDYLTSGPTPWVIKYGSNGTLIHLPKKKLKAPSDALLKKAEEIYQHYPRRVAKKKAVQKIVTVLKQKRVTADDLLTRTKAYAAVIKSDPASFSDVGHDLKYVPHAATWYGNERYMDEELAKATEDDLADSAFISDLKKRMKKGTQS